MKKLLLVAALSVATTSVFAQSFYLGGSAGVSQNKLYTDPTLAPITLSQDKSDTALKIFGGYNIDKTFAIEASYADLGKNKSTYFDGSVVEANSSNDFTAMTLALKANISKIDNFVPFVKVGVARLENKEAGSMADGSDSWSLTKKKTNFYWAVGTDYDLTKDVAVRFEYENYGKAGAFDPVSIENQPTGGKSSSITLGVMYKF
jgi:OOP family OmpA-OmpF porin